MHFIGDMHFGANLDSRTDRVAANLAAMPTPDCFVQIGDSSNDATAPNDALALDFLNALPAPWWSICGNHDIYLDSRTVADWEAAYGMQKNQVVDRGWCNLVMIGPETCPDSKISVAQATADWLDAQLGASTKPCIVCCHTPLDGTVLGWRSSTSLNYHVGIVGGSGADTTIVRILGAHDSAFAWVCGHTHSGPFETDFIKIHAVGDPAHPHRQMAVVNCSSLYYVLHDPPAVTTDPLPTVVVTIPESGDRVEARVWDHHGNVWSGSNRLGPVATVYPGRTG